MALDELYLEGLDKKVLEVYVLYTSMSIRLWYDCFHANLFASSSSSKPSSRSNLTVDDLMLGTQIGLVVTGDQL